MLSASDIFVIHRCTGLPIAEAQKLAASATKELLDQILEACRTQCHESNSEELGARRKVDTLRDPAEFDSNKGPVIERVLREETEKMRNAERKLGTCHLIWRRVQKRLREEYAICWFTPAEMNPWTAFD